MRKLWIIASCVAAIAAAAGAENVVLSGSGAATPDVRVVADNAAETVVAITVPGFVREKATADGVEYDKLTLAGRAGTSDVGFPELPALHETIMVPGDAQVRAEIVRWDERALPGYNVWPFQTPTTDYDVEGMPFTRDAAFYAGGESYPAEKAAVSAPAIFRDLRVVQLTVNPFRWNPRTKMLYVADKVTVKLVYYGQDTVNTLEETPYRDPDFDKIYRDTVLNYRPGITLKAEGGNLDHAEYLIISYPGFTGQIAPLAEFYNKMGHYTKVVTTNETGTSTDAIKAYIQDVYDETSPPTLKYVLLNGDISYIAAGRRPGYSYISDYWYSLMDGGQPDPYPDIAVGRYVTTDAAKVTAFVNATIAYQKSPPLGDDWLNKCLLVAHCQTSNGYEQCCEEVRTYNYALFNPTFTTVYGSQGKTNADISNAITAHQNIVAYRGHGSYTTWSSWSTTGASYSNAEFYALSVPPNTPIVLNVCCDNGDLDYGAETLLEAELNSANVVAGNGSSDPSYTVPNHDYYKEQFKAIYDKGILTCGYVTNYANAAIINKYGGSHVYVENCYMYLWNGCPFTQIWMKKPTLTLAASHPSSFAPGGGASFTVTVTDGTRGPVAGVWVGLYKENDIYCAGRTNTSGQVTLVPVPRLGTAGTMYVTATDPNYLGYWGSCNVSGSSDIKVTDFTARRGDDGVKLEWNVGSVGETVGFNVYRREATAAVAAGGARAGAPVAATTDSEAWVKVNDALIRGRGPYRYVDSVEAGDYSYILEAVTRADATVVAGPITVEVNALPKAFALAQNYPNPARDATTFSFALPENVSNAAVYVYDLTGRKVKAFELGPRAAGVVTLSWDLTSDAGKAVPAGVYLYRLNAPNFTATKRMVVAR